MVVETRVYAYFISSYNVLFLFHLSRTFDALSHFRISIFFEIRNVVLWYRGSNEPLKSPKNAENAEKMREKCVRICVCQKKAIPLQSNSWYNARLSNGIKAITSDFGSENLGSIPGWTTKEPVLCRFFCTVWWDTGSLTKRLWSTQLHLSFR